MFIFADGGVGGYKISHFCGRHKCMTPTRIFLYIVSTTRTKSDHLFFVVTLKSGIEMALLMSGTGLEKQLKAGGLQ